MGDKQKIPRRRRGGFWSENFYLRICCEDALGFGSRGGRLLVVAVYYGCHT